jgi:antitoxin component HigA of HigAB toxin-antitoxin module
MNRKKEYTKLVAIVKKHRMQENLPARYEDIAKELGYNRSYFSTLIGKRGVVTDDHIKRLKLTFPVISEKKTRDNREILLSIEKMLTQVLNERKK